MEHVDTVRTLPTGQTAGHPDTTGQVDTTCDPQTPVGPSGNEDLSPPEVTTDTEETSPKAAAPEGDDPVNDQSENGRVPRDDVTAHGTQSDPTSGDDVETAPDTVTKATDNSIQPIHDAANPDTTADDVTKQDGDVPDDIAVTWFRAVISGEVDAVEAILPRVSDVNIRDQVMIWEILVLFESILFY